MLWFAKKVEAFAEPPLWIAALPRQQKEAPGAVIARARINIMLLLIAAAMMVPVTAP
jgi:hypothetical protein